MFRELQLRTMLYGSSLFKLVISFTENPRISKHVFKRYRKTGQDKRRRHQGNHFIITCSSRLCFTVRAGVRGRGRGRGGGGFRRFWLKLQASY